MTSEDCGVRPSTPGALHAWIAEWLDIRVPTTPLSPGHSAPFDYVKHAFFDGGVPSEGDGLPVVDPKGPDCVVWANRGGGKTFLAAVATLLDLVFKPGIEVRVLGGSLEQAKRMHEHLRMLIETSDVRAMVEGRVTDKRVRLTNGSRAEVLAQSQTSVRGTRVQKLRCDEVELFDPKVWEAAQLVTRSKRCGDVWVPGTIECLSTMHRAHGLMWRLIQDGCSNADGTSGVRQVFKWGVVDVLDACGPEHDCASCALHEECGGRAKARDAQGETPGYVGVDDAVRLKGRVSEETWRSEMLCERPVRTDLVLPEFERSIHVVPDAARPIGEALCVCGMDFGIRAPTVVLWGWLSADATLTLFAERVVAGEVLGTHIRAIQRGDGSGGVVPAWIGIDPAGGQRNMQTGLSDAAQLRRAGLSVRDRRLPTHAGLELVRARLRPASGSSRLFVSARCAKLIESLESYSYPSDRPEATDPVKDGSDHAVDALRYLIQNVDAGYSSGVSNYL
ncbi:MAG: hypothetical protein AAGI53_04005 [Planctomycetota bacterium]